MSVAGLLCALLSATTIQSDAVTESLVQLAERGPGATLSAEVAARPDEARAAYSRLVDRYLRADGTNRVVLLRATERLAAAYAEGWYDSFLIRQTVTLRGWSRDQQMIKQAVDSLRRAGNDAFRSEGISPALELWHESAKAARTISDSAGQTAATGNLGAGFYRAGRIDSASVYLQRAYDLAIAIGDYRTAANAANNLGSVRRDAGELRQARQHYLEALELRKKTGDLRGTAADRQNLGLISLDLLDLQAARVAFSEALVLNETHHNRWPAATNLTNLANVATLEGNYAEADSLYRRALGQFRALEAELDVADVLHNLGLLELRRGAYRAAIAAFSEALPLYQAGGLQLEEILLRRDRALAYAATGDLEAASLELTSTAASARSDFSEASVLADLAIARADIAVLLNRFEEARGGFTEAERLYRTAADLSGVAEAQQGRALLSLMHDVPGQAVEELRNVLSTQRTVGDARAVALTQALIGYAEQRDGDTAAAARDLGESIAALVSLGDRVGEASARSMLGDLLLESGQPSQAEDQYRQGLERLGSLDVPDPSWRLLGGRAKALRRLGLVDAAVLDLKAAIRSIERTTGGLSMVQAQSDFLRDKWEVYWELADIEHQRGEHARTFEVSEQARARVMLDLLDRGRVDPPRVPGETWLARAQDLRHRMQRLSRELEGASRRGVRRDPATPGAPSVEEELLATQRAYTQLIAQSPASATGLASIMNASVSPAADVIEHLGPHELMLEYLLGDSTSIVIALSADGVQAFDLNMPRQSIVRLVDFTRGVLSDPQLGDRANVWQGVLRRLYGVLVAPVEQAGLLEGVQRLIIAPHAELHYLPFQALMPGTVEPRFLVERYEVLYVPSGSVWLQLRERRGPDQNPGSERVLALAPQPESLPASRDEVDGIGAMFGERSTILRGSQATERRLRTTAQEYDIVHLAGYGVLNKLNPLFSFVHLEAGGGEDGRLEVHEVLGYRLDARLVVLSACETALGSGALAEVPAGDDWVGLMRAFLAAGSANVLGTLWRVEDQAAASLNMRLYRYLADGDGVVTALATAQREAIQTSSTSHPFYWAGFVLVGSG